MYVTGPSTGKRIGRITSAFAGVAGASTTIDATTNSTMTRALTDSICRRTPPLCAVGTPDLSTQRTGADSFQTIGRDRHELERARCVRRSETALHRVPVRTDDAVDLGPPLRDLVVPRQHVVAEQRRQAAIVDGALELDAVPAGDHLIAVSHHPHPTRPLLARPSFAHREQQETGLDRQQQ